MPAMTGARQRLDAVDALRGIVICLMVVDHAREYAAGTGRVSDPMALDATPPLLFWMRWAAHFCAPVFTLLAGLSAAMQPEAATPLDRMRHLVVRGLVLVLLEFTVVHFAWTFTWAWPLHYAQVIWGLGVSLVFLGLLQPLPTRARLALGAAIVLGHNLLDGWHPTAPPALHWAWAILHDRQVMPLPGGHAVRTSYPVLPMLGLVFVGEALGRWYRRTPDGVARRRTLAAWGAATIVLFVVLRGATTLGDPHPADLAGAWTRDVHSVLNTTKYPMSLAFMAMTLGPALLVLAAWDARVPRWARPLATAGTVPMFLYVAHLYLLHAVALAWAWLAGFRGDDFDFAARIGGVPAGFGFPLWVTFPFAAATLLALAPATAWYARLRASKRYVVTRYF